MIHICWHVEQPHEDNVGGQDSLRSKPVQSDWHNNETSTLFRLSNVCLFIYVQICWLTFLAYYHEWMNLVCLVFLSYYFKWSREADQIHFCGQYLIKNPHYVHIISSSAFYFCFPSVKHYMKWWKIKDGSYNFDKCLPIQQKKLITYTKSHVSTFLILCSLSLV